MDNIQWCELCQHNVAHVAPLISGPATHAKTRLACLRCINVLRDRGIAHRVLIRGKRRDIVYYQLVAHVREPLGNRREHEYSMRLTAAEVVVLRARGFTVTEV